MAASAPVPVTFLAKEAVADELAGLRYFASDWGTRQGCFRGTVVTDLSGVDLTGSKVLVVDVSHDQALTAADVTAIEAYIAGGGKVAMFAWPLSLPDKSLVPQPLGGLVADFDGAQLQVARGCGDWQYGATPSAPFRLSGLSYRYENFGGAIFTVAGAAGARVWAHALFCPHDPGAVMVQVKNGTLAGFSIAYSVALADNNVRALGMKQLVVDDIDTLAGGATS